MMYLGRSYFIPEVFQTAAASSLSACLVALRRGLCTRFSGAGLQIDHLGCPTDASIDHIKASARLFGMELTEQLPQSLPTFPSLSSCLPAILNLDSSVGEMRPVVMWRTWGPRVQVMDPVAGRIWVSSRALMRAAHVGEHAISRTEWRRWLESPAFAAGLEQEMLMLGLPVLMWPDRAHQAAALRLARALRDAGQLPPGRETDKLWARCAVNPEKIPRRFWFHGADPADAERVIVRGPDLLSVTRMTESDAAASDQANWQMTEIRQSYAAASSTR